MMVPQKLSYLIITKLGIYTTPNRTYFSYNHKDQASPAAHIMGLLHTKKGEKMRDPHLSKGDLLTKLAESGRNMLSFSFSYQLPNSEPEADLCKWICYLFN